MVLLMFLLGPIIWEYRTAATAARTYPAIGTVVAANSAGDSCVYVIGGQSSLSQTRTNYEYDCVTNAWATRAQMPLPVRYDFGGCSASRLSVRRIYVVGGYGSAFIYYADLDEFTPSTNTWVSQADMPTMREGVRAASVGNLIYAIGGDYFDGVDPYVYDIVERYEPETNIWTTGYTAMPTARTDACCAVAVNETGDSCIYVIGGCLDIVSPIASSAVEEYNPATNSWRIRNSSGFTARWGANAITATGKIYVIGGTSDGSASLSLVQVYDPVANTWSSETSIQQTRDGTTGGVVAGRIYVVVGSNGNTVVNTNERTADIIDIEETAAVSDNASGRLQLTVFPNPFRKHATINCQIPNINPPHSMADQMNAQSQIAIAIYNSSGRLVKLYNRSSIAQLHNYSITWSGTDEIGRPVPAGVYFVTVRIDDQEVTGKIVILDK
jgi:N-acetylneuraminic acid mutarotase